MFTVRLVRAALMFKYSFDDDIFTYYLIWLCMYVLLPCRPDTSLIMGYAVSDPQPPVLGVVGGNNVFSQTQVSRALIMWVVHDPQ